MTIHLLLSIGLLAFLGASIVQHLRMNRLEKQFRSYFMPKEDAK